MSLRSEDYHYLLYLQSLLSQILYSFKNQFKCPFHQKASNGTNFDRINFSFKFKLSEPARRQLYYLTNISISDMHPNSCHSHSKVLKVTLAYHTLFYYIFMEVISNKLFFHK